MIRLCSLSLGFLVLLSSTLIALVAVEFESTISDHSIDPAGYPDENRDLNPSPTALAAIDFSLRFLQVSGQERTNTVFSPWLILRDLKLTFKASRGNTSSQLNRLLVEPNKFGGAYGSHVYGDYVHLYAIEPKVDWLTTRSGTFGAERTLSPDSLKHIRQVDWLLWLDEASSGQSDFERKKVSWANDHFNLDSRVGFTRWSVADAKSSLVDLTTNLYCAYRWRMKKTGSRDVSVGLAPFLVNGEKEMIPTVCTLGWEGIYTVPGENTVSLRWRMNNSTTQDFWIVMNTDHHSDGSVKAQFTVEEMKEWLYIDNRRPSITHPESKTTKWHSVGHVHFPCFAISSDIDVAQVCRKMGATNAFELRGDNSFKIAGRNAYVDKFESSVFIAADQNGLGSGSSNERKAQPLTCENPDLVIDQPFNFFLLDRYTFLLLGNVENPTSH